MLSHVGVGRVVEHVIGMTGAKQFEEIQPAFGCTGAEPGESVIADLRAETVTGLMPCACVVNRNVRRCLQSGAQNILRFGGELLLLIGQETLELTLRDRHADRAQKCRKPGQCRLSLMVLHQHEAA